MRTLAIVTALILTTCGCAQMGTRQTDTSTTTRYETSPTGQTNAIIVETRETATRASGKAVLSGKNTFEGLDASQDGTAQGLKVKKAAQQTDGLAQAVETLRLLKELGGMAYGIPPSQSPVQPAPLAPIAAPAPVQPKPGVILQTPPEGQKWILAPIDNPSTSQPEEE